MAVAADGPRQRVAVRYAGVVGVELVVHALYVYAAHHVVGRGACTAQQPTAAVTSTAAHVPGMRSGHAA